jgi:hypothetical protein
MRMPAQAGHGIKTYHQSPMYEIRLNVPEVWNKFRRLAKVHSAEPWDTAMTVYVDMKHTELACKGNL